MQPNLFIIGFQKCGSSSLFDFLCKHDEIRGTFPKETFALTDSDYEHFDLDKSIQSKSFSWSHYLKSDEKTKYLIEGSVVNFYQKTAF